jgi:S-formylglutathione hydrolase FrmB
MNFNLLSQNFILIICSISTGLALYLFMQLPKGRKQKRGKKAKRENDLLYLKLVCATLAGSLIISYILIVLASGLSENTLPKSLIIMVVPFASSIILLTISLWKFKARLWRISLAYIVVSMLFSLLLINGYYRFYPTIGEVFNKDSSVKLVPSKQTGLVIDFSHTLSSHITGESVEAGLTSVNNQETNGNIYGVNIPGTVSKFKARGAYVYVPAIYNKVPTINLPVVILTAGFPGAPESWIASGMEDTLNKFAASHEGITPLVFSVDNTGSLTNDTECVNSPRGNVETYLTTDVPSYIKEHFRTINSPNNWAIGGLSMGGTCSIMLALRHQNIFHYFMDYGGELGPEIGSEQKTIDTLFNGSESQWAAHQPSLLLADKNYKGLGLGGYFGYGTQDERAVTDGTSQLTTESQRAGIETISETVNGPHTFDVWEQLFKDSLPWVSNRIEATNCGSACV